MSSLKPVLTDTCFFLDVMQRDPARVYEWSILVPLST